MTFLFYRRLHRPFCLHEAETGTCVTIMIFFMRGKFGWGLGTMSGGEGILFN